MQRWSTMIDVTQNFDHSQSGGGLRTESIALNSIKSKQMRLWCFVYLLRRWPHIYSMNSFFWATSNSNSSRFCDCTWNQILCRVSASTKRRLHRRKPRAPVAHQYLRRQSGDIVREKFRQSCRWASGVTSGSDLQQGSPEAQNHPRNHAIHAISSEKRLGWMIGTVWTLLNHVKHRMPWPLQCIVCWWAKILPRWISWDFQATDVRMKDVRVCKYLEVSHEKVI